MFPPLAFPPKLELGTKTVPQRGPSAYVQKAVRIFEQPRSRLPGCSTQAAWRILKGDFFVAKPYGPTRVQQAERGVDCLIQPLEGPKGPYLVGRRRIGKREENTPIPKKSQGSYLDPAPAARDA